MTTHRRRATTAAHDAALTAKAEAALADPQIAVRIAAMARTGSPRLMRYSVRNQALLLVQAEERGMAPVTDVDTYQGGRSVAGLIRSGPRIVFTARWLAHP